MDGLEREGALTRVPRTEGVEMSIHKFHQCPHRVVLHEDTRSSWCQMAGQQGKRGIGLGWVAYSLSGEVGGILEDWQLWDWIEVLSDFSCEGQAHVSLRALLGCLGGK